MNSTLHVLWGSLIPADFWGESVLYRLWASQDPAADASACIAPANSYATCTSTASSLWRYTIPSNPTSSQVGSCGFTCLPLYQISPDGTECVLIPVAPAAGTIVEIQSLLATTAFCANSGLVSGIYSSNGVDVCGCIVDDGGTDVCRGATPACVSTTTDYSGLPMTYTSACTTCDATTCQSFGYTTVHYGSGCPLGQVLYVGPPNSDTTLCGCAAPEDVPGLCPIVDNGDTTCTNIQQYYGELESQFISTGCSFICAAGYDTSTDGTSCVLTPVVTASGCLGALGAR